jgi:hypothetical protein
VVVQQVEVGLAFHAFPAVALEDSAPDFDGDRHARRPARFFGAHKAVRGLEFQLRLALPLKDKGFDVDRVEPVVLPVDAVMEPPVVPFPI